MNVYSIVAFLAVTALGTAIGIAIAELWLRTLRTAKAKAFRAWLNDENNAALTLVVLWMFDAFAFYVAAWPNP